MALVRNLLGDSRKAGYQRSKKIYKMQKNWMSQGPDSLSIPAKINQAANHSVWTWYWMSLARFHETVPCFDEKVHRFIETYPVLKKWYPVGWNGTLSQWNSTLFQWNSTLFQWNSTLFQWNSTLFQRNSTGLATKEMFLLEIWNYIFKCSIFTLRKNRKSETNIFFLKCPFQ